jgi:GxxExxY protein
MIHEDHEENEGHEDSLMLRNHSSSRMRATVVDASLDKLSNSVIGAAIEVHRVLGPGFLEAVYEEALCCELGLRSIAFARQVPIAIHYKGLLAGKGQLDLLVDNELIVELKSVEELAPVHTAQLLSYLRATNRKLGLLINFNVPTLRHGIKRLVR